jgi:hypothetical protein
VIALDPGTITMIQGVEFLDLGIRFVSKIDLILLNLEGMDILLGMDWMTGHQVSLDISFPSG